VHIFHTLPDVPPGRGLLQAGGASAVHSVDIASRRVIPQLPEGSPDSARKELAADLLLRKRRRTSTCRRENENYIATYSMLQIHSFQLHLLLNG
jgi:hypothetical protein